MLINLLCFTHNPTMKEHCFAHLTHLDWRMENIGEFFEVLCHSVLVSASGYRDNVLLCENRGANFALIEIGNDPIYCDAYIYR